MVHLVTNCFVEVANEYTVNTSKLSEVLPLKGVSENKPSKVVCACSI